VGEEVSRARDGVATQGNQQRLSENERQRQAGPQAEQEGADVVDEVAVDPRLREE
jgi:hypothetical protein